MQRIFFEFAGAALALCLVASPAMAQSGDASDVTGVNVTSSTIAGGFFTPSSGTVSLPGSSAGALSTASAGVRSSLKAGSVTGGGISVSGAGLQTVRDLVTGPVNPSVAIQAQISAALSSSGAPAVVVSGLIDALAGLLQNPTPANVGSAAKTFTSLVNDASGAFLANPPAEFETIYAVLFTLVTAAYSAS
jgi:hypothetical protein